jgi:2-polyprenyl-3-methyl-5-hydroxy-6-metoxy-1,4-benzoquinol methylase
MTKSLIQAESVFQGQASAEKYQSANPISRALVSNFLRTLIDIVAKSGAKEAHEIGCGEGQITGLLARAGLSVRGCDLSPAALAVAKSETERAKLDIEYKQKSVYDLTPEVDSAELVLCCEVLEHLTDPDEALRTLVGITKRHLLVSVPREPIWQVLNMARGKYLTALGNTPGHYNHWSRGDFVNFVSRRADIVEVRSPLPWTVILCKPKTTFG